jgi:hypothetical protein
MNIYLIIIGILLIYMGFNGSLSKFTAVNTSNNIESILSDSNDIYESRKMYPYSPPVNSNVQKMVVKKTITDSEGENLLIYSGGTAQMIEIPLQWNDPTGEVLRSQKILVTDYNRNKYCT